MKSLRTTYPSRKINPAVGMLSKSAPIAVDFAVQSQGRMSNWCWAAVSSSVSAYYRSPASQSMCQVATAELGSNCCAAPNPCNLTWYLDLALQRVGHFRARAGGWLNANSVIAELRARNPIPVATQWRRGGYHFLAIYGLQDLGDGDVQLWLTDPIYGPGSISLTGFVKGAYQASGGRWADSYVVQP